MTNLFISIQVHRSLVQYLEFLAANIAKEEYCKLIPDIGTLVKEYRLEPEVAFQLLRPKLLWLMNVSNFLFSNFFILLIISLQIEP